MEEETGAETEETAGAEVIDTSGFRYRDFSRETETPMGEEDTWTLLIYMCGSDLESSQGSATYNLMQIMQTVPSEQVNVIVQTGGSKTWGDTQTWAENLSQEYVDYILAQWGITEDELVTKQIDPEKLQRFRVTDTLELLEEQPLASMGDAETLYDFLSWGVQNYPAEHMGVIMWDHGGGGIAGACYDELFDGDGLYPFEMREAFYKLASGMTDRFEFVGFDACLMATIEMANMFVPYARYLYGSEEAEPGDGWCYTHLIEQLNKNPGMDGAELGRVLCDGVMAYYREQGQQDSVTMSVTDLDRLDPVLFALDALTEKMQYLTEEPEYIGQIARETARSENYTLPTIIDLGDMASNLSAIMPEEGEALLEALEEAVVYSVSGQARSFATGLSIYYPTEYYATGALAYELAAPTDTYAEYIRNLQTEQIKQNLDKKPLVKIEGEPERKEDGTYQMDIDPDTLIYVREAGHLLFADVGDGISLFYGNSNDIDIDFETGAVRDKFDGAWAFLEGEPLMLELDEYFEEYAIFLSPVILNGNQTNLVIQWIVDDTEEYGGHYEILGTYAGVDPETGLSSRTMRKLQSGDTVQPMYVLVATEDVLSEEDVEFSDETMTFVYGSSVIIGPEPEIECRQLEEGDTYYYQFYVIDIYGNQQTFVPTQMQIGEAADGAAGEGESEQGEAAETEEIADAA
ncbi:MAG: clostripain-related cysteine peptidase [Eubacteriales bacterium]|nr:clostripain-related cysteine peptidase [Eubacteriales bacterium]